MRLNRGNGKRIGEVCPQNEGLWERRRPPLDCHLCRGALGEVHHGVEYLSTVGALPQWYEWSTNWEYGPLVKEDPPPYLLPTVSLCYHSGTGVKGD